MNEIIINQFRKYLERIEAEDIDKKTNDLMLYITNQYKENTICDEIVDFYDILNGNPSRYTAFARYIQTRFKINSYKNVLDVGCGIFALTTKELISKGYNAVGMDPKVKNIQNLYTIREYFDYLKTDVSNYDLLVGLEPCDATEHIILSGLKNDKEIAVVPCFAPHNAIDGTKYKDYIEYHKALLNISSSLYMEEVKILNKGMHVIRNR